MHKVTINRVKPFILVHRSLAIAGLLSASTGKNCGVPGSSHNKGGVFPVFAEGKPAIANDRYTSIKGFTRDLKICFNV